MKKTILIAGVIASAVSVFVQLPKALAESGSSKNAIFAEAIAETLPEENWTKVNYTGTDEDGNREDVETGNGPTTES